MVKKVCLFIIEKGTEVAFNRSKLPIDKKTTKHTIKTFYFNICIFCDFDPSLDNVHGHDTTCLPSYLFLINNGHK